MSCSRRPIALAPACIDIAAGLRDAQVDPVVALIGASEHKADIREAILAVTSRQVVSNSPTKMAVDARHLTKQSVFVIGLSPAYMQQVVIAI